MNKSLFKNYWFWVIVITVVGSVLLYVKVDLTTGPLGNDGANKQTRLILYFDNGTKRIFEGEPGDNTTILGALYAASLGGNFNFRYRVMESGDIALDSIHNFVNDNHASDKDWHFYVNGIPTRTADIGRKAVKMGDLIEIRYEMR